MTLDWVEEGGQDAEGRLRQILDGLQDPDLELATDELEIAAIQPSLEDVFVALVQKTGGAQEG